jgi:hypothetical protein
MSRNRTGDERREGRPSGSGLLGMPCCSENVDWSAPGRDIGQMMQACPCGGWLRRHRLAAYAVLTVVGLGFLALQVGWILGVIAFFRTV